jgi:hypothetical protein
VMEEAEAVKAEARAEASEIARKVLEDRAALEAEKAAMEKAHTFQSSQIILLNVGGHRFETSRQTLTSIPDTYLSSLFSGRFELATDADGAYFIERDGSHFRHVLNFLRDPVSIANSFTRHLCVAHGVSPFSRHLNTKTSEGAKI